MSKTRDERLRSSTKRCPPGKGVEEDFIQLDLSTVRHGSHTPGDNCCVQGAAVTMDETRGNHQGLPIAHQGWRGRAVGPVIRCHGFPSIWHGLHGFHGMSPLNMQAVRRPNMVNTTLPWRQGILHELAQV